MDTPQVAERDVLPSPTTQAKQTLLDLNSWVTIKEVMTEFKEPQMPGVHLRTSPTWFLAVAAVVYQAHQVNKRFSTVKLRGCSQNLYLPGGGKGGGRKPSGFGALHWLHSVLQAKFWFPHPLHTII